MFEYAKESPAARAVAAHLLGEDGPFKDPPSLGLVGAGHFFLALTKADPFNALSLLQRLIEPLRPEALLQFEEGRREAVHALEMIAIWRECFPGAARLLLLLAEWENETWSNNATGIFTSLFSLGYGPVAFTEAPPPERFPILTEVLSSSSKRCRLLALKACDSALEARHHSRVSGAEHQGLRPQPQLWMPGTYGELFDAYRFVWRLLEGYCYDAEAEEAQKAKEVLLRRSRGLIVYHALGDMVVETLHRLTNSSIVTSEEVLEEITRILHYEGGVLKDTVREGLVTLQDKLVSGEFSSRLHRYVGLDLTLDHFAADGSVLTEPHPEIQKLAQEAAWEPQVLRPEIVWLTSGKAKRAYEFAYQAGLRDKARKLLRFIREEYETIAAGVDSSFLGGYLAAIYEEAPQEWEQIVTDMVARRETSTNFPEVIWRSGLTDNIALLLIDLVKTGKIEPKLLRLFAYGRRIRSLSSAIFGRLIILLMEHGGMEEVLAALELYAFYYIHDEERVHQLDPHMGMQILEHSALFSGNRDEISNIMGTAYSWGSCPECCGKRKMA